MLHPLLQQHRTQLRLLQPLWTTVLQSDIRIKSAISNAAEAANRILGIQPAMTLDWVPTIIACTMATDVPPSTEAYECIDDDHEDLMAKDELEDEVEGLIDSESMIEDAAAEIVWRLPVCGYLRISLYHLIFLLSFRPTIF